MARRKKKQSRLKIFIPVIIVLLLSVGIFKALDIYKNVFKTNLVIEKGESAKILIPSNSSFDEVKSLIFENVPLKDTASFIWVAKKKNYPNHIHGGQYVFSKSMSNNDMVNMLRAGRQEPVKVQFHNIKTLEDFASVISGQIEADSSSLIKLIKDEAFISELGFDRKTVYAMFIPNTYEVYWNTEAEDFIKRMSTEYDRFWNNKRESKLEKLGMTKIEVSTLASIVDEETYMNDEKKTIAGVYLNRLDKGIRLQADPTVKFAVGDRSIKRVLTKHLEIDSPYNTYKNAGLPPGPINIPSISGIDAVLDYEKHDYYYFCARADFSGYHHFSKTLTQHLRYAREYQRLLNKNRVWR